MESLYGAVVLSTGGTWSPSPSERPFLNPFYNGLRSWPTDGGVSATAVFTDSTGALVVSVDADSVQADGIYFNVDPSIMDQVPNGANFVITLETNAGTFPVRYGQVIRKEPFYAGAAAAVANPLTFTDNFQRTALGSKWIPVLRTMQMVDNSSASLPTGVAAASSGSGSPAAIRFWQEYTTDSIEIGITVLNRNPTVQALTGIVFSGDVNLESGLCVQLNAGSSGVQKTRIGTLTSPATLIDQVAPASDSVANLDYYLIRYIESTSMVSVYKNNALDTPILQWADSAGIVPKGKGYRTVGLVGERTSTSTNGIQVTSITMRDAA
jgi:hypothetical protein